MRNLFRGIFLFLGTFAESLELNSTYMNDYVDFTNEYSKNFSYEKLEIFKENTKLIHEINQDENYTFKVEMNGFGDMNDFNMVPYQSEKINEYYEIDDKIVPKSVDWRDKNVVTDVKNQKECGSCWAFSTTGSIEGIIAIKEGILHNISEQELVDCSTKNNGCMGGSMDYAFQYVINNGLCNEKDYPYEALRDECRKDECNSVINITDYKNIYPNEMVLKRAVAQQPVSVAIQANLSSFHFYSKGIYNDPNCGDQLDHGVLIVGYGSDDELNMDYWIVKNSWGNDWGENGYIRIQRNVEKEYGMCGISRIPSIPLK